MNLTGLLPVPTPADAGATGAPTALPGFPDLVAALLWGSDVVSPEVLGEDPGSRPGDGGELPDSAGDEAGNGRDPDQTGITTVHPLLVAEAILRHPDLGSTGTAQDPAVPVSLSSGPLASTPSEPAVDSDPSPAGVGPSGVDTAAKPGPKPRDTAHTSPRPEGLEIASQAVRAEAPAHGLRARLSGSTSDSAAAFASREPKPPAKTSGTEPVPPAAVTVDASGSQPELASELGAALAEVAGGVDPDPRTGSEEVSSHVLDHRRAETAQAHAVEPSTPERSSEPAPRLLSAAAHRVEQAIRRLENAPPPNVVTFTIEELDLRLTVALRPDGIHLSSPGHQTDAGLIRSLENALAARGFDLAQGDRGRREHERPEAPWRPTTQPTRTRRTPTAETRL